jgi:hypothetical protein
VKGAEEELGVFVSADLNYPVKELPPIDGIVSQDTNASILKTTARKRLRRTCLKDVYVLSHVFV